MHPPVLLGLFGITLGWITAGVILALLLFSKRIPDLARSIGKSFGELKKGVKDATEDQQPVETVVPPKQIIGASVKPGQNLPTFSQPENAVSENKSS